MTAAENARQALRASMRQDGHQLLHERQDPSMNNTNKPAEAAEVRLPRVTLDLKLPLWGIASAVMVVIWASVSMYFKLEKVSETMATIQADVRNVNSTTIQFAQQQALLQYRVEKLEKQGVR